MSVVVSKIFNKTNILFYSIVWPSVERRHQRLATSQQPIGSSPSRLYYDDCRRVPDGQRCRKHPMRHPCPLLRLLKLFCIDLHTAHQNKLITVFRRLSDEQPLLVSTKVTH